MGAPRRCGEHRTRAGLGVRNDLDDGPPLCGCGLERAEPDARGTEIGDLVDLQNRVHVAGGLEDLLHLVGGDRVHPTAEGIELHDLQVRLAGARGGGLVQPGVVGPLVTDPQGALDDRGVDDAVLGEDGKAQPGDQLGDAVVDLRIDVIGPAGQDDAARAVRGHPRQRPAPLGPDVGLDAGILGEALGDGGRRLLNGDIEVLEHLDKAPGEVVGFGEVQERVEVPDSRFPQPRDVLLQDLRIEGDDGAVEVVVGLCVDLLLVRDAGVEDRAHAAVEQVLQVTVGQLRRIADVLRRDRLGAGGQRVGAGAGGEDHPEAEAGQHGEPERIVLVHVQHPRDADVAAGGRRLGEPPVAEDAPVLVVVEVGKLGLAGRAFGAGTALAPVAGHMAGAVPEPGDGELAMVLAQPADLQ